MKVGMFLVKTGKREKMVCRFICHACGKPVDDLREANFAPAEDDWNDPIVLKRDLELVTDKIEIWHWKCDDAGTPWENAAFAFQDYIEAGVELPVLSNGHLYDHRR